jgi:spore coat protein U-like protein
MAAGSADIAVTANVQAACSFDSPDYTMSFGGLDPATTTDAVETVNVLISCNVAAYTLSGFTSGPQLMLESDGSGNPDLPYSATYTDDGAFSTDPTTTKTLTITGTIAASDINDAYAGTYADTLTINILP